MPPRLSITLFKGWDQFAAALDPKRFRSALEREMGLATKRSCQQVEKAIRREINKPAYTKNEGLTVLLKASSKPLVGGNTGMGGPDPGGTMLRSLGITVVSSFEGLIGVKRRRGGHNIAVIMHEGATLKMTERRRKWIAMAIQKAYAKQGKKFSRRGQAYTHSGGEAKPIVGSSSHLSNAVIHIPGRPFIVQVMEDPALQRDIIQRWEQAAATALKVK